MMASKLNNSHSTRQRSALLLAALLGPCAFLLWTSNAFAQATSGSASVQLNGATFSSFLLNSFIEVGVVLWVGAQLWLTFLTPTGDEPANTQYDPAQYKQLHQRAATFFQRSLAIPVLAGVGLATLLVLLIQALAIANGHLDLIFTRSTLDTLFNTGTTGRAELARLLIILIALALALWQSKRDIVLDSNDNPLLWGNFLLALALITTMAFAGPAISSSSPVVAVLTDWLHLLAEALWIGGMLYLLLAFLPGLQALSQLTIERMPLFIAVLRQISPLVICGLLLLLITEPLEAQTQLATWGQLFTTGYGRIILVTGLLLLAMLIICIYRVLRVQQVLAEQYQNYIVLQADERVSQTIRSHQTQQEHDSNVSTQQEDPPSSPEVKRLEQTTLLQSERVTKLLRWEPLLGLVMLICAGLLLALSGTLPTVTAQPASTATSTPQHTAYHTIVQTQDHLFTLDVTITPNRFGNNEMTVRVKNSQGQIPEGISLAVYTTMLDMDMGTTPSDVTSQGNGTFQANCNFAMGGRWGIRIDVLANGTAHTANVTTSVTF